MTRRLTLKLSKMVTRSSSKKNLTSLKKIKKEVKKATKKNMIKKVLKGDKKKLIEKKKKIMPKKDEKIDDSNLLELGLLCDCTGSMSSWI